MKPTITSTEIAHQNPWYRIRHDQLLWPNGKTGQYFVAEILDGAMAVCVKDNYVLVTKQYRYTIDQETIEFPCGGMDPGEEPLEATKRELREETGYIAKHWESLGSSYCQIGTGHDHVFHFLATDVEQVETEITDQIEINQGLHSFWMPIPEFEQAILTQTNVPQSTIVAWFRYLLHTGRAHSLVQSNG